MNRKQEKKMKENLLMLEDERRHADQYKEQAEKVLLLWYAATCSHYIILDIYVFNGSCKFNTNNTLGK